MFRIITGIFFALVGFLFLYINLSASPPPSDKAGNISFAVVEVGIGTCLILWGWLHRSIRNRLFDNKIQISFGVKLSLCTLVGILPGFVGSMMIYALFHVFCIIEGDRSCIEKSFESNISEYASMLQFNKFSNESYIVGKVVVVDLGERIRDALIFPNKISDVQFLLPEKMRAYKPKDVGTVILLNWTKEYVFSYIPTWKAYRVGCEVTVIDKNNTTITARRAFKGDDPPSEEYLLGRNPDYNKSRETFGETPRRDVITYIETLPQRDGAQQ